MTDEHRAVTLRCPRCGAPIVCSLGERTSGTCVEAAVRSCRCQLDEDERDRLGREIAALLKRRDAPG